MKKVGIQLFSLPKMLDEDFRGTLEMLSGMGYQELELFGPYPFSAPETIEGWKNVAPMLGFSGSGYFGHSAAEVKSMLDEFGLTTPSVHTDLITLETRMAHLGEAADTLGFTYVVLPAIPEDQRTSLDDYKRMADRFNAIGEAAKASGVRFAYHNHGYGLQEMEGEVPLYLMLKNTDPDLVFFEMDVFWTTAGGIDPVELIRQYPDRYYLLHLKDMKEDKRFSGDGSNMSQWMELFPYMTNCGDGVIDLDGLIEASEAANVKHYLVEQDLVADPQTALKASADYLKGL